MPRQTPRQDPVRVLVVAGLAFEARIAAGAGVDVVQGLGARQGRVSCELRARLEQALDRPGEPSASRSPYRGIVSFGTCGALVPGLSAGDWIVGDSVMTPEGLHGCAPAWSRALARALDARLARCAGSFEPVLTPQSKHTLHLASEAVCVDMESALLADLAATRGLPFVICRVVIDSVARTLPPAALAGMRADGSTALLPVLRSLLAAPAQLPALLALARDAARARAALQRGRAGLGAAFGAADLLGHGVTLM